MGENLLVKLLSAGINPNYTNLASSTGRKSWKIHDVLLSNGESKSGEKSWVWWLINEFQDCPIKNRHGAQLRPILNHEWRAGGHLSCLRLAEFWVAWKIGIFILKMTFLSVKADEDCWFSKKRTVKAKAIKRVAKKFEKNCTERNVKEKNQKKNPKNFPDFFGAIFLWANFGPQNISNIY